MRGAQLANQATHRMHDLRGLWRPALELIHGRRGTRSTDSPERQQGIVLERSLLTARHSNPIGGVHGTMTAECIDDGAPEKVESSPDFSNQRPLHSRVGPESCKSRH